MTKKIVASLAALLLLASVSRYAFAQDTNTAAAGTNAPAAAPPADTGPKPDPAGILTGGTADAQSPA
ncbi:MAG TPA: hypothetical protein VH598_08985, partial [Verrucomicrobiae bacterium]|nr:hypothetical protein [Verrucomicrobiae bacterium]